MTWSGEAFPLGFHYHKDFTPHSAIVWALEGLQRLLATSCLARIRAVCSSAKKFIHVSCKSIEALGSMPVPTLFDRSIRVTRACSLQGPRSFALMVATLSNVSALSIGNGWQWLATTGNDWRRYPRCHHLIIAIRRLPWPTGAPREARPVSNRYVLGVASQFVWGR
jgi:hypothetical protein